MATANYTTRETPQSSSRSLPPDPTDSYEALKSDLSQLGESVKKLVSENMGSAVQGAQQKVEEQLGGVEQSVRKNPIQAAAIAAGVGFLIGLVITR
jgi:ElaB/YqjD/DUF883 family membrane-anchored ribosome-binding protein